MNLLYLYLDAYADASVREPPQDDVEPLVIGDLGTREPPQHEEGDAILLSLI
jgi:hypothetical protein